VSQRQYKLWPSLTKFAPILRITNEHKDLDMIILNSGIQRGLDFSDPSSIDLSTIDLEMRTNYFSYIHLLKSFLPFLQAKKEQTALVFMTSGLALAPLSRCPNYCASKAALHSLIMSLRFQLEQSGKGNIKVIEILPPAVQSTFESFLCSSPHNLTAAPFSCSGTPRRKTPTGHQRRPINRDAAQ
jgi:short-subunit dehydrogenase involved in D-alanine esterification of teichoic acids